jgi:hypothetical protein
MRPRPPRPSVGAMTNTTLIRIGAVAAVLGVVAQLATAVLMPIAAVWDEDPADAARALADTAGWDAIWLVHLAGAFLIVTAFVVVGRTFSEGPAREWAGVGDVLLAITGAVAVVAVLLSAGLKDLADAWATGAPSSQGASLAAFAEAKRVWTYVDLGGILAFSLYLATLAAAVHASRLYPRWIGWGAALAAPLVGVGVIVELRSVAGTVMNAVGTLVFLAVLAGLALALWRQAAATARSRPERAGPLSASRGATGS